MPLRAWIARRFPRLAGFCRWLWLARADRLPEAKRPRAGRKPPATFRPSLEVLGQIAVPNDILGVLQGGALLPGAFETPASLLFSSKVPLPASVTGLPSEAVRPPLPLDGLGEYRSIQVDFSAAAPP